MGLGSLIRRAIPTAIGFATGGPIGAVVAGVSADQQADQAKKIRLQNETAQREYEDYIRRIQMAIPGTSFQSSNIPANASSGFGAGFGNFLTEASTNILSPLGTFTSGLASLFGRSPRPQSTITQPALTTVTNIGAQESQGSGTQEAFVGGLPNIIGQASRFLRTPGGIGSAIGGIVGGGLSLLDGSGRPLRITRKMKRLAQQAYQLAGMNLGTATSLFAQLSGVAVDERTFVLILTKRFRNDGPVVTKAALRKTKTTIRRLKNMCDMYDSLRPRATARRRATPMRRASTTLIKN
jgi:gas vesicle protein